MVHFSINEIFVDRQICDKIFSSKKLSSVCTNVSYFEMDEELYYICNFAGYLCATTFLSIILVQRSGKSRTKWREIR